MAGQLEIERKFLIEKPPPGWKRRRGVSIAQGYFPVSGDQIEIRLRQIATRHVITVKSGSGRKRREEEIKIPRETFRALWPLTRGARIEKQRYRLPWNGLVIELDEYRGRHRGLVTAEIEFESLRQSRSFQLPEWFGREVTDEPMYSNAALARRTSQPKAKRPL